MEKKIITVPSFLTMPCNWSVGHVMEKFFDGLVSRKITGIKCGACGKVYVPPQQLCPKCFKSMEEWVDLSGEGEVVNYTVAHVDIRNETLDEPKVIGMIKLDGADTAMMGVLKDAQPGPELIGRKVKAVFRDETKGNIRDISHYEPA